MSEIGTYKVLPGLKKLWAKVVDTKLYIRFGCSVGL